MAGYSGTPLPKKLGIKDKLRVFLSSVSPDVTSELKTALSGCDIRKTPRGPLDFAMLFVKSQAECKSGLMPVVKQLAPAGMVWVCWPKKSSGIATDLNENDIRRLGLAAGLVDIKVCAVDEIWSGLKFVIPVAKRKAR